MGSFSFDIKTSEDFYKKLKEEYKEYLSNTTSSTYALNCTISSWHLVEWAYKETNGNFRNLRAFQNHMKDLCPSLQLMQDLTNGTKHTEITFYESSIARTDLYEGTFDDTFDDTFDTSQLEIELKDGRVLYFKDVIELVIEHWDNYFQ